MKRQAIAATFWSGGDLILRHGLQFATTLVLARLLVPADFGVMAMLAVFTEVAQALANAGLSAALIQRQDVDHRDESTVFWFNLCVAAVLALLLCICAPLIADFYRLPAVTPLVRVMALSMLVSAVGSIHFALLSKRLDFRLQAKVGGVAAVVSGGAAIGMALAGFGVWSLAVQSVLMAALTSALLWLFNPWRPARVMDMKSLRKLLGFGAYQTANILMETVYSRLYSVIIGRMFGAKPLGYYGIADTTRSLPALFLVGLVSRVALPMFARANGDAALYRRGIQLGNRMMMMINLPAAAAMMVLAEPIIEVLFGKQWLPAAQFLRILAIAILFYPLHVINLQALMAQGHARLMFRLEVAKKVLGLILLVGGAKFGLLGIAWSQALHSLLCLGINAYFTRRWFGYGALAQLMDVAPSFIAAACAAVVAMLLPLAWPLSGAWEIAAALVAGGATYVAVLAMTGGEMWNDAKALLAESVK